MVCFKNQTRLGLEALVSYVGYPRRNPGVHKMPSGANTDHEYKNEMVLLAVVVT